MRVLENMRFLRRETFEAYLKISESPSLGSSLPLAVASLQKIQKQYIPLCITHRGHKHNATENVDKWGRPEVSASANILWVVEPKYMAPSPV